MQWRGIFPYCPLLPAQLFVEDRGWGMIGKPFLETIRKFEVHFDEIFPGSFFESQEA